MAEIARESRLKIAQRLVNYPSTKMVELHLEPWYRQFWKIAGASADLEKAPEIVQQILAVARKFSESVRRQYFALALLMFGEFKEFNELADKSLWSKDLRADFETFVRWHRLSNRLDLKTQASIVRNQQIKSFLLKKYSSLIEKYSSASAENCPRASKFRIYYCWFQGKYNLPPLVQSCYDSLKENSGAYEICFVDEKNFAGYVELPNHILQKFADGKISRTHLSDILRVNILERYGGLWLDATILITEPLKNHHALLERRYFTQKFYREKDNNAPKIYVTNPSYGRWATFAQGSAYEKYPLFSFMKEFYAHYWDEFDSVIDYVFMDFAMDIAYEKIPAVHADMDAVPLNNTDANTLVFHLNDSYENYPYDKILAETFMHKLSWHVNLNLDKPNTVYKKIRQRYSGE